MHDKVSLPLVDVIGKLNTVTQELNEFKELKSNLSVNKYVSASTQTVSDNTPINTQNLETDNKIVDTTTEVDSTNNNPLLQTLFRFQTMALATIFHKFNLVMKQNKLKQYN